MHNGQFLTPEDLYRDKNCSNHSTGNWVGLGDGQHFLQKRKLLLLPGLETRIFQPAA